MNNRLLASFAGICILALAGVGLWWALRSTQARPEPPAPTPIAVNVMEVQQRDVPHLTSGIGTVQSLHNVTIRSQVDGVLTQVLFAEGQLVEQGDLLATIDDRAIVASIEQARAEKARNDAQLKQAQIDLKRYTNLLAEDAIAAQTVDQQAAQVQQLRAAIAANEATVAAGEVQRSYTRIVAPVRGRVGIRRVDAGNLVRTTDAEGLVTVTQIDPIAVMFSLPQDLLPRIQDILNQRMSAPVTALDRAEGEVLARGRLATIDNEIDASTGTIMLKAEFPNTEARLWPGQFVAVQLQIGLSDDALVISPTAIQRGRDEPFVYRVEGDKVEVAPVAIEYETEDVIVIGNGLAAGDTVVSDGQSRLKPGARVKVQDKARIRTAATDSE